MEQIIALNVVNSQALESGLLPQIQMDAEGGSIGAASSNRWVLRDRAGDIPGIFCRIQMIDGAFCVEDLCGSLCVNGATQTLGIGKKARLNDNDSLAIGPYLVRASILDAQHGADNARRELSGWLGVPDDALLCVPEEKGAEDEATLTDPAIDDPLLALDAELGVLDEKTLLGDTISHSVVENHGLVPEALLAVGKMQGGQADTNFDPRSAITLSGHKHQGMEVHMEHSDQVTMPNELDQMFADWEEQGGQHLAAVPMMKGLGVSLGKSGNVDEQQALSMEMGAALQAAIKGLLSLHLDAGNGRYDLINKNLQPIEDNPLRLGLGYEETVRTLFDDECRSEVHLSPAAAISESLQTLANHNQAVNFAIGEALENILASFSPDVLQRRFSQYRKASDIGRQQPESWSWTMYQHYYRELTSSRQQGFSKLFWEVFEQAYDKKIRELQRAV
ncbi:type VI secretion system-associated FHA domain protein TagH [Shewanella khirikhana]|uniref:type VI secretion system-associated FHA domain protein TagH n=1 Tax=Shewanella khirikhana TaxID=1965282 RepID=UPI0030D18E3C